MRFTQTVVGLTVSLVLADYLGSPDIWGVLTLKTEVRASRAKGTQKNGDSIGHYKDQNRFKNPETMRVVVSVKLGRL